MNWRCASILADTLATDRQAQTAWQDLFTGKRRGLAYRVASAKTFPTQQKRAAEVLAILRGEKEMPSSKLKRKL